MENDDFTRVRKTVDDSSDIFRERYSTLALSVSRGKSQIKDGPGRTPGVIPAHPASSGDAHPPEQDRECPVDLPQVLPPGEYK